VPLYDAGSKLSGLIKMQDESDGNFAVKLVAWNDAEGSRGTLLPASACQLMTQFTNVTMLD
jgi:hypothetical protein